MSAPGHGMALTRTGSRLKAGLGFYVNTFNANYLWDWLRSAFTKRRMSTSKGWKVLKPLENGKIWLRSTGRNVGSESLLTHCHCTADLTSRSLTRVTTGGWWGEVVRCDLQLGPRHTGGSVTTAGWAWPPWPRAGAGLVITAAAEPSAQHQPASQPAAEPRIFILIRSDQHWTQGGLLLILNTSHYTSHPEPTLGSSFWADFHKIFPSPPGCCLWCLQWVTYHNARL